MRGGPAPTAAGAGPRVTLARTQSELDDRVEPGHEDVMVAVERPAVAVVVVPNLGAEDQVVTRLTLDAVGGRVVDALEPGPLALAVAEGLEAQDRAELVAVV